VSLLRPGRTFPLVLRNLHLPAIVLNLGTMLLVLALIPLKTILGGSNVLSILAEVVSGLDDMLDNLPSHITHVGSREVVENMGSS
jgi:hypothetical protein